MMRETIKALIPAAILALVAFLLTMRDSSGLVLERLGVIDARLAKMEVRQEAEAKMQACQALHIYQLRSGTKAESPCPLVVQ